MGNLQNIGPVIFRLIIDGISSKLIIFPNYESTVSYNLIMQKESVKIQLIVARMEIHFNKNKTQCIVGRFLCHRAMINMNN